jgi:hypothetical protein
MTCFNRSRPNFSFLFGNGADGNVTISSNTNLSSTTDGDIIYKNYMNLTINSGCTLSVSNRCKGLWIRVRGTLVLNGTISMTQKAPKLQNAGSDLYLCYSDIKVPAIGAAGGARVNTINSPGNPGGNGVDGQCGGGGSGGFHPYSWGTDVYSGAGAAGFSAGGGSGGSGAGATTNYTTRLGGNNGLPYGGNGGNGVGGNAFASGGGAGGDGSSGGTGTCNYNYYYAGGGSPGAGGVLIIMANRIEGTGSLTSIGSNGGWAWNATGGGAGGGGGSGGGSITLYYATTSADWPMNVAGGAGGAGAGGGAGGAGGYGTYRYYSIAQLASHTRV